MEFANLAHWLEKDDTNLDLVSFSDFLAYYSAVHQKYNSPAVSCEKTRKKALSHCRYFIYIYVLVANLLAVQEAPGYFHDHRLVSATSK